MITDEMASIALQRLQDSAPDAYARTKDGFWAVDLESVRAALEAAEAVRSSPAREPSDVEIDVADQTYWDSDYGGCTARERMHHALRAAYAISPPAPPADEKIETENQAAFRDLAELEREVRILLHSRFHAFVDLPTEANLVTLKTSAIEYQTAWMRTRNV